MQTEEKKKDRSRGTKGGLMIDLPPLCFSGFSPEVSLIFPGKLSAVLIGGLRRAPRLITDNSSDKR